MEDLPERVLKGNLNLLEETLNWLERGGYELWIGCRNRNSMNIISIVGIDIILGNRIC